jgi:hypothetical protein
MKFFRNQSVALLLRFFRPSVRKGQASWVQGHLPCLFFLSVIRRYPPRLALFFFHPQLRNFPSGPNNSRIDRIQLGGVTSPYPVPRGHEGATIYVELSACVGACLLRIGLALCGSGRIPPSLS